MTLKIDVHFLPYHFVVTSGLKLAGDNVRYLPVETENTKDFIADADYCITKACWGTVAEVMISGTKTALIERPDVPEDVFNISELIERGEVSSISIDELKNSESVLRKLENLGVPRKYSNNYRYVGKIFLTV